MRTPGVLAILLCSISVHGQSLADAARANREQKRAPAKIVLTDDDVRSESAAASSELSGDAGKDLNALRFVLQNICADPKTDHGKTLSTADRQSIADAQKPLRARVQDHERMHQYYKDEVSALNKRFEAEDAQYWPVSGRPLAEWQIEQSKALRKNFDAKKSAAEKAADDETEKAKALQKEIEATNGTCPAAAKAVPY